MTDKVQKIIAEIKDRISNYQEYIDSGYDDEEVIKQEELKDLLTFIDSLQEEPKECMYSKDNYTDEDRKALCDGCETECRFNKKEEPVSEDLEDACEQLAKNARKNKAETSSPFFSQTDYRQGVMDGAKWQKANLWKPSDGDDLPEYEREVVVLTQPYPLENSEYAVSFAHRPNPNGWDGKSVTTGKVEHYTPKTYGKGGWNIPDIVYWLDVELPKEIEL